MCDFFLLLCPHGYWHLHFIVVLRLLQWKPGYKNTDLFSIIATWTSPCEDAICILKYILNSIPVPKAMLPSFFHPATYRPSLFEAKLMCRNQNSLKLQGDSFLYKSIHQNVPKKQLVPTLHLNDNMAYKNAVHKESRRNSSMHLDNTGQ